MSLLFMRVRGLIFGKEIVFMVPQMDSFANVYVVIHRVAYQPLPAITHV